MKNRAATAHWTRAVHLWSVCALCFVLSTDAAQAAEFSVYPIGLSFPPGTRADVVGINNADKRPLRFQITLVEWTQDADGKDVYTPSDDLLYFPRQLTVPPNDKGIVRVGPKRNVTGPEKAYRLRVEELAEPAKESTGSSVTMTITFAIPVYTGTPQTKPTVVISPPQLENGKLKAKVENGGATHFRIESLEVKGADGFSQKAGGWYLLAGASREHTLEIPAAVCRSQRRFELVVRVDERDYTTQVDTAADQCGA